MEWPTDRLNRELRNLAGLIVAGLVAVGVFLGWVARVVWVHHRTVSRSDHR